MKINVSKEIREDTRLSRLVIHGLVHAVKGDLVSEFSDNYRTPDGVVLDIRLTCEGEELNIESFVEQWQKYVRENVKARAKELVKEKLSGISDLISELETKITDQVNDITDGIIDDWEIETRRKLEIEN